jgi:L-aspartate oxidase
MLRSLPIHPRLDHAQEVAAPRYVAQPPGPTHAHRSAVLVVGAGLAGLSAALRAADHGDVLLMARGPLSESNSAWAQGGIAAALEQGDTPRLHLDDTVVAGAGLSDHDAIDVLTGAAPDLMRELAALGVPFEQHGGQFALGLEGGHRHRRILHVGDATGWAVTRVLLERALAHPRIRVLEGFQLVDLLTDTRGRCLGALAIDPAGGWHTVEAGATILATGGAGALFGLSSNPPGALGEGIAVAYRAGAEVTDMEFVQFHPTVYQTRAGAGFLISEAARGEGGRLLTPAGRRFMPAFDQRAELAPRDVVTRGIYAAMRDEGCNHVLLDLTHLGGAFLERRFPTIVARLREDGVDPAREPIPVAPAAHYLMGGIRTDLEAATSVAGLFAAGECACTGVHGANRLASNSLLECLVFGRRAGERALAYAPAMSMMLAPADPAPQAVVPDVAAALDALQTTMRTSVGPLRTATGLRSALDTLDALPRTVAPDAQAISLANAALAARLIANAALLRRESRGGHFRADYPEPDAAWTAHISVARGQVPTWSETVAAHEQAAA